MKDTLLIKGFTSKAQAAVVLGILEASGRSFYDDPSSPFYQTNDFLIEKMLRSGHKDFVVSRRKGPYLMYNSASETSSKADILNINEEGFITKLADWLEPQTKITKSCSGSGAVVITPVEGDTIYIPKEHIPALKEFLANE